MRLAPSDNLAARLSRLRQQLKRDGLEALVVSSLPNIAYLTAFFGSAGIAIASADRLLLIGDGRYATVLADRVHDFPLLDVAIVPVGSSYEHTLAEELRRFAGHTVGFEAAHTTVRQFRFLEEKALGGGFPTLKATNDVIDTLRLVKDDWEIGRIREGAGRLSEVGKCILPKVLAGITESGLAAEIEYRLRLAGFERAAFDTIVASGPRAALPHARASARTLESGDLVILDFGGVLDGYCTDVSRTVVVDSPTAKARELLTRVAEAQQAAFDAVIPGKSPEDVDGAAREHLARSGLADLFTHGTGHGLGLEVHEGPRVTRHRPGHPEPALAPGMVITLEPGVYLAGFGGVRIEDDVLVTTHGAEWLTKELGL